jgi:glycosyltransferase involved in cell wall biosynthesis
VGNRVWLKRHDIFVQVASRILEDNLGVCFRIFGEIVPHSNIYYKEYVENVAKEKGILQGGKFDFISPGTDIPDYFRAMDIFVLTSTKEGTSLVTQEAMSSGVPVVAFSSGSLSDAVIHGETGFLAKTEDVNEFIHYICMLINDSELRLQLGVKSRKRAIQYFTVWKCAEVHYDAFEKAIEEKSK